MDWSKLGLERIFLFLTALIPGAVSIFILSIHHSDFARHVWTNGDFGYQTKLIAAVLVMFVAGWTLNSILFSLTTTFHAFAFPFVIRHLGASFWGDSKPWHDKHWRSLVGVVYGMAVPKDEGEWQAMWNTLNLHVMNHPEETTAIRLIFASSLESASILILLAAPFTPELRHWWLLLPALYWSLKLLWSMGEVYRNWQRPYNTHYLQVAYLNSLVAGQKDKAESAKAGSV